MNVYEQIDSRLQGKLLVSRSKDVATHLGAELPSRNTEMRQTIPTRIACGVLFLAFAMMLTDVCKLMLPRLEPAVSAANSSSLNRTHRF